MLFTSRKDRPDPDDSHPIEETHLNTTLFVAFMAIAAVIGYCGFSEYAGRATSQGFRVHHAAQVIVALGVVMLGIAAIVLFWAIHVHQAPVWMDLRIFAIQGGVTALVGGGTMLVTRKHHLNP